MTLARRITQLEQRRLLAADPVPEVRAQYPKARVGVALFLRTGAAIALGSCVGGFGAWLAFVVVANAAKWFKGHRRSAGGQPNAASDRPRVTGPRWPCLPPR
ncbi:MAG: hypothetical protein JWO31_126 [Phycisphaerales bacterium]|nr:hypothetical protein [Phycisphaerales bacterium]